jgi:hypothetical protein
LLAAGVAAAVCFAPNRLAARAAESGGPAFRLVDGDRVVLLGGTLIEHEQSHGYLEAALVSRFPGADIQFRNLGRSGDAAFGEARPGLGKPADRFAELTKHVLAISPTVILLNHEADESLAGQPGLERFASGLEAASAALAKSGARMVLIGPPPHETLPADPTHRHRNWRLAPVVEQALGLPPRVWQIEIDAARDNIAARGTKVRNARFARDSIRLVVHDRLLPFPPPPDDAPRESRLVAARTLRAFDLAAGTYVLKIDGRQVASGTARQWADGVNLTDGPEFEQAERLRRLVVQKNELFFARWRPPRTIELFGMRQRVPGRPVAIPRLDPLVAARDAAIRGLSKPLEHEYELVRVADKP